MILSWLFDVTREILADTGLFEQRSSYPAFLSNSELDDIL